MESDSWIIIISILLLIGGSAFFSASETAISTFNKIRMKKKAEDGDKKAALVLKIHSSYDHSLSAILVGNNIVNITASTLGTLLATAILGPVRGAVAATVTMTLIVLLFGEIMPKCYSKENADKTALAISGPLMLAIRILYPVSHLLTRITGMLSPSSSGQAPSITEEELIYMMDAIEEEGILEEQERDLVKSALEFDEVTIKGILTPRVNIAAVDVEAGMDEIKQVIIEEGYSRIPVFEKNIDNIIGVLYTRDFLLGLIDGRDMNIRDMLGEPLFVHKGMKLSHLLASFKAKKLNLAVVVDEYGGTLGIVTMKDIIEELVGDIWDEDDEIPNGFTVIDENRFELAGDYSLNDMFEKLVIDEDSVDTDYSTVGGWALQMLGHIPKIGEGFTFSGCRFTALEMDGHRLKKLGIERLPEIEISAEDEKSL